MSRGVEAVGDPPAWTPDGSTPELIVRDGKHDVDYLPTWSWIGGEPVTPRHADVLTESELWGIEGLMYPQDALKLYELAWFTPGPIFEIGTYHGRSSALMARALEEAGNPARILSVDISEECVREAQANLARLGLGHRVTCMVGTAPGLLKRLSRFRPGLAFVDGDHTFRGVTKDLRALEPVLPNGSILVLHDYQGYEEEDPYWIRVAEAAHASWVGTQSRFLGRFGLSGVFVRTRGGPSACDPFAADPLVIDLGSGGNALTRRTSRLISRLAGVVDYRVFHLRRSIGCAGSPALRRRRHR